jgi:ATP-binding cassette subfamily F protein uup
LAQWEQANAAKKTPPKAAAAAGKSAPVRKKLSWAEAREWEQIEQVVERAEEVLDRMRSQLELPEVVSDPLRLTAAVHEMDSAQAEVDRLYARWAELEAKQA